MIRADRSPHTKEDAFTLFELIMVVALVGIMSALAGPSFTYMLAKNRVKATSSDLQVAFLKARSEAIKRNSNVTISPNSGSDWSSGWQVLDADGNDLFNIPAPSATINTHSNTADIIYRSSGRISGAAVRQFTVYDSNLSLDSDDKRCVRINLSGMPVIKAAPCA